jgi:hypothetical protein
VYEFTALKRGAKFLGTKEKKSFAGTLNPSASIISCKVKLIITLSEKQHVHALLRFALRLYKEAKRIELFLAHMLTPYLRH